MKPVHVILIVLAAIALLFVILNWQLLGTPITVSFGFARPTVPLGLVLLGMALLVVATFLLALLRLQLQLVSMHRRHAAELRSHRELAEQAENSRIHELRQYLEQEISALRQEQRHIEERLQESITTSGNALSACVGEIDERLERHFPVAASQRP